MVKLELRHFNATEVATTMTSDSKILGDVETACSLWRIILNFLASLREPFFPDSLRLVSTLCRRYPRRPAHAQRVALFHCVRCCNDVVDIAFTGVRVELIDQCHDRCREVGHGFPVSTPILNLDHVDGYRCQFHVAEPGRFENFLQALRIGQCKDPGRTWRRSGTSMSRSQVI